MDVAPVYLHEECYMSLICNCFRTG